MSRSATAPAPARWTGVTGALSLHRAALADGRDGARYIADVLTSVLEEGLEPTWYAIAGDYPYDWVGVEILLGSGAKARVFTVDMDCRACAIVLFDSHGCEVGRANFENLPAHLAAAVVVVELVTGMDA